MVRSAQSAMRSSIGSLELDEILHSRQHLNDKCVDPWPLLQTLLLPIGTATATDSFIATGSTTTTTTAFPTATTYATVTACASTSTSTTASASASAS